MVFYVKQVSKQPIVEQDHHVFTSRAAGGDLVAAKGYAGYYVFSFLLENR